ncbi:uncharacterized protein LOC117568868 [Drosophila albomicans]|uniref:Uncharacterized protein LOC117568868 n=1 Tax=Drosophila albomicans TaxID=7291 RepID=A0A6P8X1R0_DROAB|nr:uncharacterized protein LOC117568868 [Drosophila albomicans]
MKFTIVLFLSMLVTLACSQPVFEEEPEIESAVDELSGKDEVGKMQQDETVVAEPLELVDAMDKLIGKEQGSDDDQTPKDSQSRQKRAVCRCVRRGRRVVCVCRRK